MAKELDISRSKLNAHENGHTINPPVDDLLLISRYFNVSIDHLLKTRIRDIKSEKLNDFISQSDEYARGSELRVLAISVDANNDENIEYVPVKATAGYRVGYKDPDYIASLPKFSFPDLPKGKTYRMFPTVGDSMLPIPEGSDILTSYVRDWTRLKPNMPCIVIFKNGDFVFKNITVQKNSEILLRSTNDLYRPYSANALQILEIWKFERFIGREIPQAPTELSELKTIILDMKQQLTCKR